MNNKNYYMMFENRGEIDLNAFKLIGASSKRGDDSMIGMFGSGLKYALACLMRNSIDFKIYSGTKEIAVDKKRTLFRGKKFDVILINNEPTSMTTDMGFDWLPWFAIREIYCNAIDEKDFTMSIQEDVIPRKGYTRFFIDFKSLKDILSKWNNYFSDKRTDLRFEDLNGDKIYRGRTDILLIYRKGIQVYESGEPCVFHYDFKNIDINESRVVKDNMQLRHLIAKSLASCSDVSIIEDFVKCDRRCLEWKLDFDWYDIVFSDEWLTVIGDRYLVNEEVAGYFIKEIDVSNSLILPRTLVKKLRYHFGNKVKVKGFSGNENCSFIEVEKTDDMSKRLEKALKFLSDGKLNVSYEIVVVNFKDSRILGKALMETKTILISERVFSLGLRELVATIVEEYGHLESGSDDETRGFQNYLINLFINEIEKRTNSYI